MAKRERRDGSQSKSGRRQLEDRRDQKRWDGKVRRAQTNRRKSTN